MLEPRTVRERAPSLTQFRAPAVIPVGALNTMVASGVFLVLLSLAGCIGCARAGRAQLPLCATAPPHSSLRARARAHALTRPASS